MVLDAVNAGVKARREDRDRVDQSVWRAFENILPAHAAAEVTKKRPEGSAVLDTALRLRPPRTSRAGEIVKTCQKICFTTI
jgi:hypothetical protein